MGCRNANSGVDQSQRGGQGKLKISLQGLRSTPVLLLPQGNGIKKYKVL